MCNDWDGSGENWNFETIVITGTQLQSEHTHKFFFICQMTSCHPTNSGKVLKVDLSLSPSLSLRFNGHLPGEPGLAGVYWSKG